MVIMVLVTIFIALAIYSSVTPHNIEETFGWFMLAYFGGLLLLGKGMSLWLLRSWAKPVRREEVLYEGRAYDPGAVVSIAMLLLLWFLTQPGALLRVLEGDYGHLYLLIAGFIILALALVGSLTVYRSRLFVEEKGLVLRWSILRSVPPRYIPFDDLVQVKVKGRILSFRGKSKGLRGKLVVRKPYKLRGVLQEVLPVQAKELLVS